MPLPDERPRQSVANLIGRFEKQLKSQPSAASLPSRSSSVVSHTTGDSAREEVKEKREWPPKSVIETAATPAVSPPSSYRFKSPVIEPEPLPTTIEPPTPTEPTTNGNSEPKPEVPEVSAEPAPTQPELEVKDKPAVPKSAPSSQTRTPSKPAATTTTTRRTVSATAPKTTVRSVSATRTPAKPAAVPASSPPTQPLKPQLTGRSSLGKATVKPTPTTPARPRTPSRTTSTPSRSSGLYAPTAASLARARGAPSPVPTLPKKVVTGNALDRLSKPTAASLSRTRSPAAVQPTKPTTTAKTATSPKPATRVAPSSGGKVPATPSRKQKAEETPVTTSVKEVAAPAAASPTHEAEGDVFSAPATTKEEKPVEEVPQPTEPEPAVEEVPQPTEPEPAVEEVPQPTKPEAAVEVVAVEEDRPDDSTVVEPEVKVVVSEDEIITHDKDVPSPLLQEEHEESPGGSTSAVEDTDPVTDKLAALAAKHDGTDIEQIVNLLETVPVTKAASDTNSTPSDIQEIPDED